MSGHRHNPTADTQNQGNTLGDRSCVRQSKLYRTYESGNGVKSLLGSGHLAWNPEEQEGAYSGQRVYDHNKIDPLNVNRAHPGSYTRADEQYGATPGTFSGAGPLGNSMGRGNDGYAPTYVQKSLSNYAAPSAGGSARDANSMADTLNGNYYGARGTGGRESSSYGAPPRDSGYGAPPRDSGYGAPPRDSGYGAPPRDSGYGAPPRDSGYGAPPRDGGYSNPPYACDADYNAPSRDSGYGAPPRDAGYSAPRNASGYTGRAGRGAEPEVSPYETTSGGSFRTVRDQVNNAQSQSQFQSLRNYAPQPEAERASVRVYRQNDRSTCPW